ncbi:MAG: hypothetical protein AABZ47_00005, partial [Planctomycetota bacterium]
MRKTGELLKFNYSRDNFWRQYTPGQRRFLQHDPSVTITTRTSPDTSLWVCLRLAVSDSWWRSRG